MPTNCSWPTLQAYKNSLFLFGGNAPPSVVMAVYSLNLVEQPLTWRRVSCALVCVCVFAVTNGHFVLQHNCLIRAQIFAHSSLMSARGKMLIYGGITIEAELSNEMLCYDCSASSMREVEQKYVEIQIIFCFKLVL